MSEQDRKEPQPGRWSENRDMEERERDRLEAGRSTDHHGLAGQQQQQTSPGLGGVIEGSQRSDGSPQMGWSQNADDIGRQYDQSGFAQGGQDGPQQQGWSGETRADRQQFQSEHDEQIQDDGSMTREQKLQQGWQDPEDPSQIADEGLIDEDENDTRGGRI